MVDLRITSKDVGSCMGGETYFGSDTKEVHKSYLQSHLEPHNEEEDKATPLGCEPENLVEEHATIVSLHEEGNIKNVYDKDSDFYSSHVYLQPYDPWEDEKSSLAYEDCKKKDNCEGDEYAPSLLISEPKINAEEGDTTNDDKGYFGSDPKEVEKIRFEVII